MAFSEDFPGPGDVEEAVFSPVFTSPTANDGFSEHAEAAEVRPPVVVRRFQKRKLAQSVGAVPKCKPSPLDVPVVQQHFARSGYKPSSPIIPQATPVLPPVEVPRWVRSSPMPSLGLAPPLLSLKSRSPGFAFLHGTTRVQTPHSRFVIASDNSGNDFEVVHNAVPISKSGFATASVLSMPKRVDAAITSRNLFDRTKSRLLQQWLEILCAAGESSTLFRETRDSNRAKDHRVRVILHFAPGTLTAYFSGWATWQAFAAAQRISVYKPSHLAIADFLHVHCTQTATGSALNLFKALKFITKNAGFDHFHAALGHPLVKAYTIPATPSIRREAVPLPLSFIVWMERIILTHKLSVADRLVIGAILVLVWASLRWSDGQWASPLDLVHDDTALRGLSRRTKVTSRGMPFGIISAGFLSQLNGPSWVSTWMNLVRQAIADTKMASPSFEPDFLIPVTGPDASKPVYVAPMSRSQGIVFLRRLMQQHVAETGQMSAALHCTGVHSAKVTLLSWSIQMGIDEQLRRAQGHHRLSSVTLYSRDDVHPCLELQRMVRVQILKGFRPVTPVLRGAAVPHHDIPVTLLDFPGSTEDIRIDTGVVVQSESELVDSDSGESVPPPVDESIKPFGPSQDPPDEDDEVPLLLNNHTLVAHVALPCDLHAKGLMHIETGDDGSQACFKFACGARLTCFDTDFSLGYELPEMYRLCQRPACAKAFA